MLKRTALLPIFLALPVVGLAGCTNTPRAAPVDAIRYHLGSQVARGTVQVEPVSTNNQVSLEYQTYADAVSKALAKSGFNPQADGATYIAAVSYSRSSRGTVKQQSPFRIGLGAGTGGSGVGVGGGASVGLGGKTRELVASELTVQLKRQSDSTVVWEGHATTESLIGTPSGDPKLVASKLADAMFKNFPGESGITITVE